VTNRRQYQVREPNVQQNLSPGPQGTPTPTPSPTPPSGAGGGSSNSTSVVTSNSVPASSLSGTNHRPTVLAGSTTAILSDLSPVSSVGTTSANSLGTASPTVASVASTTSKNTTPIIVGSILAATLGLALVIAIITWFLRIRSRRRSEDELSWDPEPTSDHSYDNDSFFDSPSPFQVSQDRIMPPARPRPPGPTTRFRPDFFEHHTMQSPYPRLATPELAHATGPLTVTNLMPGDVPLSASASIFMGSRPGSAQATPRIDNSAPRFMRLQDGGLPVPWSHSIPEPTKGATVRPGAWPSRLSAASLKKAFLSSPPKSAQPDPPQPRTSATNLMIHFDNTEDGNLRIPESTRTADRTWPGSIRTGITNALNVVMRTSVRQSEPPDHNLTPIRPRPNRRLSSKTGISTIASMSRMSTPLATVGYTMEETSEGRGVVHLHSQGRPRGAPRFDRTVEEEGREDECATGRLPFPGFPSSENAPANVVIMRDPPTSEIPRVPDNVVVRPSSVPRLPTIRPLSRAWASRNEGFLALPESEDGYRSAFNQMINERKQEYDLRLAELETVAAEEASRPIISRASTTSLITESTIMSRESSVMDEEERKAKKVLRMRRKRAMALSAFGMGNGKITGRRASLRKNTSFRGV